MSHLMTSKSICTGAPENCRLRCFGFARGRTQNLAGADHRYIAGIASLAAVLGECASDLNLVSEFHGRAGPATALKSVRRSHFKSPVLHRAVGLLDVDVE